MQINGPKLTLRKLVIPRYLSNDMDLAQLYQMAINGNASAEQKLFDYLGDSFRAIIRLKHIEPADAEDIVQTALLRIASSYRQTEIQSSFAGWVHTVLRNQMIDHFRKRKLDREKSAELAANQPTAALNLPNPRLKAALLDCLKQINEQNPKYAQVFTLTFRGYESDEICEQLALKRGTLYVILSRARAALKECLRKKGVLGG